MALKFYDNFRENVAYNPSQRYINDMQAAVNAQWLNSTQTTGNQNNLFVKQETFIGSKIYEDIEMSIDMGVDLTTGARLSNDFKIFSCKDLQCKMPRGTMYQFENNYWITIDLNNYASPMHSVLVRRCNQVAKWIDETGTLIELPCIVGYDVSGTGAKYDKDINTANGHFDMIIQGNADTLKLKQNQRFLFNGNAYKLTGYNNMLQNDIVDQNTTLLYFDLYLDTIEPYDDLVNNIANANELKVVDDDIIPDVGKEIIIMPFDRDIAQGDTLSLQYWVYSDGIQVDDVITYSVSGADKPQCYTISQISPNEITIQNNMRSISPLIITFNSGELSKSITIYLRALY